MKALCVVKVDPSGNARVDLASRLLGHGSLRLS
jgi:hypothetical protein